MEFIIMYKVSAGNTIKGVSIDIKIQLYIPFSVVEFSSLERTSLSRIDSSAVVYFQRGALCKLK